MDINSRLKGVTDREKWAARGASFVAKLKATKAVWFPPEPVGTSKKAASTAKKTTKRAAKRTTGAAKKSTPAAKSTKGTKAVTSSVRRKKT
jgi:hypothetical protein